MNSSSKSDGSSNSAHKIAAFVILVAVVITVYYVVRVVVILAQVAEDLLHPHPTVANMFKLNLDQTWQVGWGKGQGL